MLLNYSEMVCGSIICVQLATASEYFNHFPSFEELIVDVGNVFPFMLGRCNTHHLLT